MKPALIIFSILLLFLGCKKNDYSITKLEGTYQTSNTVLVQAPVMYLQNRQITDTGIINNYLRRHNLSYNIIYTPTQNIQETLLTLIFKNGSVNYIPKGKTTPLKASLIEYSDNEFLIQQKDTFFWGIKSYPERFRRCDTLINSTYKFPHIYNYIFIPGQFNGYIGYRTHNLQFPLLFKKGKLILPLINNIANATWNYTSYQGNCRYAFQNIMNLKASGIENNLKLTDTIIVQEKSVELIKIK